LEKASGIIARRGQRPFGSDRAVAKESAPYVAARLLSLSFVRVVVLNENCHHDGKVQMIDSSAWCGFTSKPPVKKNRLETLVSVKVVVD